MNPAHKIISQLVNQFQHKGIEHIVISPGSRNAPIANAFIKAENIECYSIVDERSAGFVALGMAQQLNTPVALLCTSGSAALNYAPAIVEAYYQKIPLVVITSDRPLEYVNQGEGQTIQQNDLYHNYVKDSFQILQNPGSPGEHAYNSRVISAALNLTTLPNPGPVHINFGLDEPLYEVVESIDFNKRVIDVEQTTPTLNNLQWEQLVKSINSSEKVMILCGTMHANPAFSILLNELSGHPNIIVLTETTGNTIGKYIVNSIDKVLATIGDDEESAFQPNLLITFSDQLISKKIKFFLRKHQPKNHWHVDPAQVHFDTFQCLTKSIPISPIHFIDELNNQALSTQGNYRDLWMEKVSLAQKRHEEFLQTVPFSDLKVFDRLLTAIPKGTNLQMGNSSPVRYIQLFDQQENLTYNSNRGTSGIEGCSSTAVGASIINEELTLLITGELGFFYDNNALWNNYLNNNLRIIVINNGGGGIFRIIDGPDKVEEFEKYISTEHNLRIELLAKLHGLKYFCAENEVELDEVISSFMDNNLGEPAVLEVVTPTFNNATILRNYFKYLKHGTSSN